VDANDILIRISAANRGPETAVLHLLPTLWFRNTWSWDPDAEKTGLAPRGRRSINANRKTWVFTAWRWMEIRPFVHGK